MTGMDAGHRGRTAGRSAARGAALAGALLAAFAAGPYAAAQTPPGALEVTLGAPAGVSGAVLLQAGTLSASVSGRTHRFDAVPPGRYAVTAEIAPAVAGAARHLGVADVTVGAGAVAKAAVELVPATDVDAFCRGCHPDPVGDALGAGLARDLHPSGPSGGGRAVTCESCHTAHRPTGHPSYAVAPFRTTSDLCVGCHDRGHAASSPEACLNCHTLRAEEVEKGTSLVSAASRTLPVMKSLAGGKVPEVFGCTYCHSSPLNLERMRGVLLDFGAAGSKHPVGHDFRKGRDTMSEYFSSTATSFPDELDCVDCHDPALLVDDAAGGKAPYTHHAPPAGAARKANPAMLRGGSADALCLACHGRDEGFAKADAAVRSHGDRDLKEKDGTPLKTSACTACHNAHSSGGRKLFRDGAEGGEAVRMGDAKYCTALCHEPGDAGNSHGLRGHGRDAATRSGTPMRFGCGTCHSVDAAHDGPEAGMLNFERDKRLSRFGTSLTSVCSACHRGYTAHAGEGGAGCLDCHDEHAEGSGGNLFMIGRRLPPGASGGQTVVFEKAGKDGFDHYRAAGQGLCDNAACHGGLSAPSGAPLVPLSGLMKEKRHSGGDQAPGTDCGTCHPHGGKDGSWTK